MRHRAFQPASRRPAMAHIRIRQAKILGTASLKPTIPSCDEDKWQKLAKAVEQQPAVSRGQATVQELLRDDMPEIECNKLCKSTVVAQRSILPDAAATAGSVVAVLAC